jgi:hypothetical protein
VGRDDFEQKLRGLIKANVFGAVDLSKMPRATFGRKQGDQEVKESEQEDDGQL